MIGKLIGDRTGQVVEVWHASSIDDLWEKFFFEGHGYSLDVTTDNGYPVCYWQSDDSWKGGVK